MSIAEKLNTIANNQSKVYDAGKKAEHDDFWDNNQDYGNREDYTRGYNGNGKCWNKYNFYPKHAMRPTLAEYMFYAWEDAETQDLNLTQRLIDCNAPLDTSNATQMSAMFAYGKFTSIPTIDLTSCISGKSAQLFQSCPYLVTIEKIKMHKDIVATNWFRYDSNLENLEIEGEIGQNGFNVKDCKKLTQKSLLSILKALYLGITETKTITFSIEHQKIIETDAECKPYWESAKQALR